MKLLVFTLIFGWCSLVCGQTAPSHSDSVLFVDPLIHPKFDGGEIELLRFIYCNIDLDRANYPLHGKETIFLCLVIDSSGVGRFEKVVKGRNKDYIIEAKRIIEKMPKWIPARLENRNVDSKWVQPIVFDIEEKRKYCP